jgi:hypothetical protein
MESTEGRSAEKEKLMTVEAEENEVGLAQSRRGFLKSMGGAGALTAAGAGMSLGTGLLAPSQAYATGHGKKHGHGRKRVVQSFLVRHRAAQSYLDDTTPASVANGDEHHADLRGSFFKCLPQDSLGEVDRSAYRSLLEALRSGRPRDFEAVPLSSHAQRRLANPQASRAFDMMGRDSHATYTPPAPAFASAEMTAEMAEIYWLSLTREVPFAEFETSELIAAAASDLNALPVILAPTDGGSITPRTIFRGGAPGDLSGPYLSQFLWLDVPYGASTIVQRYPTPVAGIDFMTDYDEWLAIQRGAAPVDSLVFDPTPRHLYDGRSVGQYVHVDALFQAFLNAALIVSRYGPDALDRENPYLRSRNQDGFITFGGVHLLDLVAKAARVGLEGAWYHKWLVHRRLRPEVYAARVENQLGGAKSYGISSDLLSCEAVERVVDRHGNALLPQAYPEGSPNHPAYPAGHSAVAGACATVLKAFVDEDFVIPDPVQASSDGLELLAFEGEDLTLGHEINKLATNISIARCTAGVHYRADAAGLQVGEDQAIGILRDYSITYSEHFAGFTLQRFDGTRIRIVDGRVVRA